MSMSGVRERVEKNKRQRKGKSTRTWKVKPWKVQSDGFLLLCTWIVKGSEPPRAPLPGWSPFSLAGSLWWEISFMLTLDLTWPPASLSFPFVVCSAIFIRGAGLNLVQINNGNRRRVEFASSIWPCRSMKFILCSSCALCSFPPSVYI